MPINSLVAGNLMNAVFIVLGRHGFSRNASLLNEQKCDRASPVELLLSQNAAVPAAA